MRLQTKFVINGLAAAAAVAAVVVVDHWAIAQKDHDMELLRIAATVTQRHMESDMMHDAMHGDVFAYELAYKDGNTENQHQALADLEEHYKNFTDNLSANQKEEVLPDDLKALFAENLKEVEEYYIRAKAMSTSGESGWTASHDAFNEEFSVLEEKMGVMSDKIHEWADSTQNESLEVSKMSTRISLVLSLLSILLSLFVPYYAWRAIFRPQGELIAGMQRLADGHLDITVVGKERQDEIGDIAKTLDVFKANAVEKVRMQKEQEEAKVRSEQEKKKAMVDLANAFESRVQGIITSVAAAATELSHTSSSLANNISDVSHKTQSTAESTEKASHNVNTVAAASEEMAASVKEISSQVTKSTQAVNEAVAKADTVGASANSLEIAAKEIGNVVELIRDIAEQINLLALNATIESARAGEAGKGFSVVASEVKNLANQTTKATEEISQKIASVQSISSEVAKSLGDIKLSIDHVNEYAGGIAAAVEEQSATTVEIAKSMQIAAHGTQEISSNVSHIKTAAIHANEASDQLSDASKMLSKEAEKLNSEVASFLADVRHG